MEVALALRTEMATDARTTGAQCWPNSVTVNSLIGATVHSGDLNAALRLLDDAERSGATAAGRFAGRSAGSNTDAEGNRVPGRRGTAHCPSESLSRNSQHGN